MKRSEFREAALAAINLFSVLSRWTPGKKDDQVASLLYRLFHDDVSFHQVCDLLGLPSDSAS